MHITRHDSFDSLAAWKPAWNELARGVPFRAWEWLEPWWRNYGCGDDGQPLAGNTLLLLAVWSDEQRLVAIAPWYLQTTRSGTRLIRFLGNGEVCSEYPSVLCNADHEAEVAKSLAEWLVKANNSPRSEAAEHWDRLELTPLDPADTAASQLLDQLEQHGNRVYREAAASCWRVPLADTWDGYLAGRSKQLRNRLRHADRTWMQSGKVKLRCAPQDCDADKAFDILVDLHQRRWESRGLPGCFASRAFAAFHRDVWKSLAATGQALIYWLEMGGKPIAVDYVLLGNKTMCGYQSGVDPDHMSMQPGQLMNSTAIRAALESGYQTYDFLRGDEPYKAHLGAERHEMLSASVVPQNAEARLRYAAWNAGRQMRGLAKRGWRVARQWNEARHQPDNVSK